MPAGCLKEAFDDGIGLDWAGPKERSEKKDVSFFFNKTVKHMVSGNKLVCSANVCCFCCFFLLKGSDSIHFILPRLLAIILILQYMVPPKMAFAAYSM